MAFIKTQQDTHIYYEDLGSGQPVILIHGWPLSGRSWEYQVPALLEAGFRVITYDRKGFGRSEVATDAYDYDALAGDLHDLIRELGLENVVLVGFSMGGGEVVRYLTNYGAENIWKVALIASIIPLVKQKDDNPDGVPQKALDNIMEKLQKDRVTFLKGFFKNFYNVGLLSKNVSDEQLQFDWNTASQASPIATLKCAESWAETDFRTELKNVTVPTLIVHGDDDQIVPIETSAQQAAAGIAGSDLHVIKNAPHGLNITHAEELNELLLNFLQQ